MKARLTQKNLVFGIYRGAKGSLNPGLVSGLPATTSGRGSGSMESK
jgi:hypothetical protein